MTSAGFARRIATQARFLLRKRQAKAPTPRQAQVQSHRIMLIAGVAGAIVFVVASGFGARVSPAMPISDGMDRLLLALGLGINEITITGQHHTLDQDIFRAIGPSGATLLALDVEAARRRIEELPWIESATLVRVLPDKLRIEVRERQPAAVWLDGDRTALVDASGRVLSYVASFVPPGLPRLAGPGAPEAAAELNAALLAYPDVGQRVHLARFIGGRRWDLELSNGTRVRLAAGSPAASLDRLARLERETRALERSGVIVDLTIASSISVSPAIPPDSAERRAAARPPARRL